MHGAKLAVISDRAYLFFQHSALAHPEIACSANNLEETAAKPGLWEWDPFSPAANPITPDDANRVHAHCCHDVPLFLGEAS